MSQAAAASRPPLRSTLERYFEFDRLHTDWRTEALAGLTTFATMAYIIFVNPAILSQTGMPAAGVMTATCLSAGFASILMGAFARYPIALAPGMGLNAYFTYSVVKGMGIAWQTALGAVFLSGIAFLLLTVAGVREKLVSSLPRELYSAVAVGIGLFIALIGFRNAGIVVSDANTGVALGNLKSPGALLAILGLALAAALESRRVRGALLIAITAATAASVALGLTRFEPRSPGLSEMFSTFGALDIRGAWGLGLAEIVLAFLFVDLFDNLGTLVGVTKKAGLMSASGSIPRVDRILAADSIATIAGSIAGTSTVVSYIESTAGLVAGGRSGVTAIVTGLLFLASIAAAPLAGLIPAFATAPALILVGAAMASHAGEIDWRDTATSLPAFVTIVAIPFTFSIANGLALGFSAFTLVRLLAGRGREVSTLLYALTLLFAARFVWLAKG